MANAILKLTTDSILIIAILHAKQALKYKSIAKLLYFKFTQGHPDVCLALSLNPADLPALLTHY